jgi:hypothetical protein
MDQQSLLYPSETLQTKLHSLGLTGDLNLGRLGELLPVGAQTVRVNSFWYCMDGHALFQAEKEVDARALLIIHLLQQQLLKIEKEII